MVAGEASGDLLAGLLMGGMRARWPQLSAFGIGGPRMAEHGFDAWWPHEKLAVRGYFEVLLHYAEIAAIRRRLAERLLAEPPDAFIGVDAPDFNLALETRLRARGIKSIHFVSPSIWAWRGKRIEKIRRAVDHVLCVFPFEPAIYAEHGIPASYVGHPLADAIPLVAPRAAARVALGIDDGETLVALLPGSRSSEIAYIAPRLLAAAALMHAERPALRFALPVAAGRRAAIEALLPQYAPGLRIDLPDGRSHEVLAACDVTLIASGTATLEAALFRRPMVIAYVMNPLSWQLLKRMGYQPWVGLPNILLADQAVPELLQGDATPARLAAEAFAWLDDGERCARLAERFAALHQTLRRDTASTATAAIAEVLGA